MRAAVVVGGAGEVVELEDDDLAARHGDVAVGGEAADAVVERPASWPCSRRRRSWLVAKSGSKATPSSPRSPAALTVTVTNGVGQQRAVLDDPQRAALLGDEEPAVGRERHGGRGGKPDATSDSEKPVGRVAAETMALHARRIATSRDLGSGFRAGRNCSLTVAARCRRDGDFKHGF